MRLEWSQAALQELNAIRIYIAERNPKAAEHIKDRIVSATYLLARRPFIGRIGRIDGTREFVFTDIPYIAVYDLDEVRGELTILHVFHTAQLYPPKGVK
jgi:toxin ParE1/3/4